MADFRQQIQAVQEALKAGRQQEARALLQEVVRAEPDNYRAWLLLAAVAPSPRASLDYVARAERLNPGDPTIARARAWAEGRLENATVMEAPATETAAPTPPPAPAAPVAATGGRRRLRQLLLGVVLLTVFLAAAAFVWLRQDTNNSGEATPGVASVREEVTPTPAGYRGYFAPRNVTAEGEVTPAPTASASSQERVQIAAKPVTTREDGAARPTWTLTPSPTVTPSPTPTVIPTFVSNNTSPQAVLRPAGVGPNERWIDVNLSTQKLVAYEGNTPVYDSLVSSGTYNYPTVTGQFRIWLRFRSQTMDGRRLGYDYYLENVPYVMYFYEDYALHGTFWHNNFGTPMSHGCVNLPTPVAEWIFNWSEMGTVVSVHY